jgi:hypothetical protein
MTALGQKRSFRSGPPNVSFAPKADIQNRGWTIILRDASARLTAEQIQAAVRVASVVHAIAATLDGEAHSADLGVNSTAT